MARASRRYGRLARALLCESFSVKSLYALAFLAVAACSHTDATPAPSASASASAVAVVDAGASSERPHTTSPQIAVKNMDIDIAGRLQAYAKQPGPDELSRLVDLLLARSQFEGKMSDLETVDKLTLEALPKGMNVGAVHLSRANALAAVHKFSLALAELKQAEKSGAPGDRVAEARASVLQAVGKYDDAAAIRNDHDEKLDPPLKLAARAALAGEMQKIADSERMFADARAKYHDVSPFALAWMDFQHASLLERRGERDEAKKLFAEANATLPSYTHAAVHLAALETPENAVALLQPLVDTSDDPEVLAGMTDALRRTGKTAESDAMRARAKARYDELLKKYPEAFADHAAAFYLGPQGDVKEALALAMANVENRKTEQSIELLMTAALASNSLDAQCLAVREGAALPYASPAFRANFVPVAAKCGDAGAPATDGGTK